MFQARGASFVVPTLRVVAKALVIVAATVPLAALPLLHGWWEGRAFLDNVRAGRLEFAGHIIPFAYVWAVCTLAGGIGGLTLWALPSTQRSG